MSPADYESPIPENSEQERINATVDVVALCSEKARAEGLNSLSEWLPGLEDVPVMKTLLEWVINGNWSSDKEYIRREMKHLIEKTGLTGIDRLQLEIAAAGFDLLTQGLPPETIREELRKEFQLTEE